ncbi:PP0621 family protein [Pseudomonas sp. GOM6]|uniref:PP0621 family protein n=1 Tax=Pseudomonas sp. GOM6 TaxID=3036944 RepID=UPI002409DEAC|nr:PP0621 family protein [Pseudomonas sp. GOM6]MDG1582082.1 PP0621 family protein [Pseudomonas sp. GOM6]
MVRLLFWIALIAAVVWLWRRINRPKPASTEAEQPAPMVRCAHCGVHVPRDKALPQGTRWYCSQAHLNQDSSHSER